MGIAKKQKGVASNISSAANPAASSTTQTANKSSILRSSFSPSRFQLSLFASVIQGVDSQHLRIHETTTGRLRCDHALGSKASITCLDWGYHGANYQGRHHKESQRKRKRSEQVNGATSGKGSLDAVVAFGTTDSEIHLFSPAESKVMRVLGNAHTHGVRDFRFREDGLHGEGWSIGGDGRLVLWDLRKGEVLRTEILPHGPANSMRPFASSVICASHNAYIWDSESQKQPPTFTASTNIVQTILTSTSRPSQSLRFLTAAETDHFIPVFDAESPTLIGSLPTENEVLSLDSYSSPHCSQAIGPEEDLSVRLSRPQEALLVVNKDGALEIFPEPFDFGNTPSKKDAETPKARAQRINRRRAALVRIRKEDKRSTIIPLVNGSFQGNDIVMAWAEGGVGIVFDKVRWLDEASGNLILKDETDIMKAKSGAGVEGTIMNGVKDMGRSHVDESRTVVANGDAEDVPMADEPSEIIEISSGEESESEDEVPEKPLEGLKTGVNGDAEDEDVTMHDTRAQERADQGSDVDNDQPEAAEEPSFGDLIRANAPEAVDVQASFADPNAQSLVPTGDRALQQLPSGMSLGTVLTQSLRTNDTNLLETCFHVRDLQTVRATIERLDSSFATSLLQKLAERLHSRPGRAGSLMVWIQWTLVAHGGYLAAQPELMKKLASLHRVVKDRANSLQSLLTLKGKLDMLEAQMNLRKSMQSRSRAANALEEDDEEGVIYVEGQDESDSEEGEEEHDDGATAVRPLQAGSKLPDSASSDEDSSDASSEDEESGDEMPNTANGIVADSEDEGSDSEQEGLFDEEASSTDHDSVDEGSADDVDHESVDSVDSSDADASPPPKRPAKNKLSNGVGARKR